MPWPLIHVLPKRLRVLCRELTGNLLGMDERNFPQHNGNLISEGVTVAIPVLQHFTASTDFVSIITVRQKTKISHSQCNTLYPRELDSNTSIWYMFIFFSTCSLWSLRAKLCSLCIFIPQLFLSIIAHRRRTQRHAYKRHCDLALVW